MLRKTMGYHGIIWDTRSISEKVQKNMMLWGLMSPTSQHFPSTSQNYFKTPPIATHQSNTSTHQ